MDRINSIGVLVGALFGGKFFLSIQDFIARFLEGANPFGNVLGGLFALLLIALIQYLTVFLNSKKNSIETNSKKKSSNSNNYNTNSSSSEFDSEEVRKDDT